MVDLWLDGVHGVFYGSEAELPEDRQTAVRALLGDIVEILARIRDELRLTPQRVSSLGMMRAYLSELWTTVIETRGQYLRGYGEVPAELETYLDGRVQELESLVNRARRIIDEAENTRPAR